MSLAGSLHDLELVGLPSATSTFILYALSRVKFLEATPAAEGSVKFLRRTQ